MRITQIISVVLGSLLLLGGVGLAFVWTNCRAYVGPDQVLVLVRKTGEPMPPGKIIAEDGQKGIQRTARGPGRYFLNPFVWNWSLEKVTTIPAGDPKTWREVFREGDAEYTVPRVEGSWPQVGVVTSKAGDRWEKTSEVVDDGFQGIQRNVLTPGTYRINPLAFEVKLVDAVVVPMGCVGVVTSQIGDTPEYEVITEIVIGPDGEPTEGERRQVFKLAAEGERGVLSNVLQPGLYYLNPYVHKVKIVKIGYNQITQLKSKDARENIAFPSRDGFTIEVEVTVVWGRHPEHTPQMINRLGDVKKIEQIILGQIRSICRNIGSDYDSIDFIRGEKRELYQRAVTETLQRVAREKDIEILIALIHNIEVRSAITPTDTKQPDLKETIQRGYIAEEQDLTKQKQRETAIVLAKLETAKAGIEIAREQISAETRKVVAEALAEGEKKAQEIDAQRDLEVARIERKIAQLDAEKTRVLGKAHAVVEELANRAEADGKAMMIEAFGDGRAYNLYTFAQNFNPESIRLIFAGEGTFWTDLSRLQDAASMELLNQSRGSSRE